MSDYRSDPGRVIMQDSKLLDPNFDLSKLAPVPVPEPRRVIETVGCFESFEKRQVRQSSLRKFGETKSNFNRRTNDANG